MEILEAKNSDQLELIDFIKAILAEFELDYDERQLFSDLKNLEESYENGWLTLIKFRGKIVGSVALYPITNEICELRKMYLAPSHRKTGLGFKLFNMAIEKAREMQFQNIRLETSPKFLKAIKLYERNGFVKQKEMSACKGCDLIFIKTFAMHNAPSNLD